MLLLRARRLEMFDQADATETHHEDGLAGATGQKDEAVAKAIHDEEGGDEHAAKANNRRYHLHEEWILDTLRLVEDGPVLRGENLTSNLLTEHDEACNCRTSLP